jgi:hypothetical protein
MPIKHLMTFGTFNEQRYFVYPDKYSYQGVVFNANMVAHAPDGLGQFILEKTNNLPYLIDPMTHAFQHEVLHLTSLSKDKKRTIKTSIDKLSKSYGNPILEVVGKRPLNPTDFKDEEIIMDFCHKCLEFQSNSLSKIMVDSDTNKKYLQHEIDDLRPYALIAPYFYIDEINFEAWHKIQYALVVKSIELKKDNKLFALISLSKGLIEDKEKIEIILNAYSKLDVNGYVVWVDNFDEHNASISELNSYLRFCSKLNPEKNKELINLHGSYFSILAAGTLGENIFTGVVHGPEYGEYRSVIPVGGGIPFAKYYIPKLHQRVKYKIAQRLFSELGYLNSADEFYAHVCSCKECKDTIENDPDNFIKFGNTVPIKINRKTGESWVDYPTIDSKLRCLLHYLERKNIEYNFALKESDEIFNDLNDGINQFKDILGDKGVSHLSKWKMIFEDKIYLKY